MYKPEKNGKFDGMGFDKNEDFINREKTMTHSGTFLIIVIFLIEMYK